MTLGSQFRDFQENVGRLLIGLSGFGDRLYLW